MSKICYFSIVLFSILFYSCKQEILKISEDKALVFDGRIDKFADGTTLLIGSASSVSFGFTGDSCQVILQSIDSWEHHNYVSIVIDGIYQKRLKIEKGERKRYKIEIPTKADTHQIQIFKATEATTGNILFGGALVENFLLPKKRAKKRIEFIGNSITCGMGNDFIEIPCGKGEWFDQHNAYWAYGPILSRELDTDFLLSSVSGIGMYRGWNDENIEEPNMPQVYENLYLTKQKSKPFHTNFQPDIVSICLGTNDLSDGDGIKPRLPFNDEKYIANYISFINTIYKRYPKAQIVLLNSPMLSGERNTILVGCLKKVLQHFESDTTHKKIVLFEFQPMQPKGCTFHPDIEDHKIMAQQLSPLFKKLLDEK